MYDLYRGRLLEKVAELDGCYEPLVATTETATPFAVVNLGPEISTSAIFSDVIVYVQVYSQVLSEVLSVSRLCRNALNRHKGISYQGTSGSPFYDENLKLWYNTLVFESGMITTEI